MLTDQIHAERSNDTQTILVVGDWVIDEHWLVGVHRSRTSTRVGHVHYRSIQNLHSSVMALCGAGRTAGILYRAQAHAQRAYNLIGIGIWHPDDTEYLRTMLDPGAVSGRTPHQINLRYETSENPPMLGNLAAQNVDTVPGTTKVIRLYQQTGSTIKLVERIDWELNAPENGWYSVDDLNRNSALKNILAATKPNAIVVQDFLKGVVSSDLVGFLVQQLPGADWFLSSKSFDPPWREKIPTEHIRLIEIPEAAMQNAVDAKELDAWLTRQGTPSKAALTMLDHLGEKFFKATLVLVPNEHTVLAHRRRNPSEKEGSLWVNRAPEASPIGLPMASVCFAAFTANMLRTPQQRLSTLVDLSLSFTESWRAFMRGRLEAPMDWDPLKEPRLDLAATETSRTIHSEELRWTDDLNRWNAGYKDKNLGVITEDGKQYIELWRAMTLVKNYICIARSKRKVLRQILDELEAFKREERSARSCMIVAAPGSGKSLLAQLLAEDHALHFLEFNITQMISKGDLLDCFDLILTTQFENPGKRLLVFVDEIDAYVAGEPIYDAFLGPLERGVYRRAGKTFPIKPCFWLFAGTADPRLKAEDRKGNDFVSRLTLKPVVMKVNETDSWQLENVYLGVALLRVEFPDVREVSTEVLEVFHGLPASLSIRELRQFVRDFVDIRSGEVRWQNVPQSWYQRLAIRERNLLPQETMVEIRGQAGSATVVARFTAGSAIRGAKAAA
jgi:ATPase family associated with various cellular activities (AAA)